MRMNRRRARRKKLELRHVLAQLEDFHGSFDMWARQYIGDGENED